MLAAGVPLALGRVDRFTSLFQQNSDFKACIMAATTWRGSNEKLAHNIAAIYAQLSSSVHDKTPLALLQVISGRYSDFSASPGFCSDRDFGFLHEGVADGDRNGKRLYDMGAGPGDCLHGERCWHKCDSCEQYRCALETIWISSPLHLLAPVTVSMMPCRLAAGGSLSDLDLHCCKHGIILCLPINCQNCVSMNLALNLRH